jgi:hypothetical protein
MLTGTSICTPFETGSAMRNPYKYFEKRTNILNPIRLEPEPFLVKGKANPVLYYYLNIFELTCPCAPLAPR